MKLANIDEDMIYKYIDAEMKTMYPKIGIGEVDGLIKVQRMSAETGESIPLNYIDYNTFNEKIRLQDDTVLNYFSLNPSNYDMCIAYSETIVYKDYNDNIIDKSVTLITCEMDYQSKVYNYATPLNYFISMHMICQDEDFMNELLEMIDETEIVLSFIEATEREIKQVDYTGEMTQCNWQTQLITRDIPNPDYDPQNPSSSAPPYIRVNNYETTVTEEDTIVISNENIMEYEAKGYINVQEYHIIEKTYDSGSIFVTTANTWRIKSKLNIEQNEMISETIQDAAVTQRVDIDESDEVNENEESSGVYYKGWIEERTSEVKESFDIAINETEGGYDLTDFIDMIKSVKYGRVKNNLETAPSFLFYLLEKNENTQELSTVMKYVIFQLTGDSYGVTELDLADILSGTTHLVGSDYVVYIELSDEELVITDIEILKRAFSGYSGSSKLIEHAQDFLDMQEQYKVNAIFAAAVSIGETSAGRAGNAINGHNNWFNIIGDDKWKYFSSEKEGILAFGNLIANDPGHSGRDRYFPGQKYTVSTIGANYCPNTEDHPTQADKWIEDVIGYMTQMYRAAGIDANPMLNTSCVGNVQDLISWAESYVGASQYPHWGGGYKSSRGTCAAFVKSAYHYAGLGDLYGVCGTAMGPIGERGTIVKKSDGTVDYSQIPIGSFLVVPPGADGSNSTYGHTALYVGEGFVIEAGGSVVQKHKINENAYSDAGYSYWVIPQGLKDYMNSSEYRQLLGL